MLLFAELAQKRVLAIFDGTVKQLVPKRDATPSKREPRLRVDRLQTELEKLAIRLSDVFPE